MWFVYGAKLKRLLMRKYVIRSLDYFRKVCYD